MSDTEIDTGRVVDLLNIAAACTGHSGKLSNLQSWAIGELIAINGQLKDAAAAEARAAAEAQQRATGLPEEPGEADDDPATMTPNQRRL